jgi:acetolactate synthase-1/2/3 large subunit
MYEENKSTAHIVGTGETMNTAQVLVELLKEYRVEHIFGVPGDTTMVLYDALYAARGEITHIMARDERSAAFMADAYARLTHKPGITEAPSGGGATYVIPGVAEANGSSVPMVVFTSDVPVIDEGKGTLTAIDQQRLLQAATKWSTVVKRSQMLPCMPGSRHFSGAASIRVTLHAMHSGEF